MVQNLDWLIGEKSIGIYSMWEMLTGFKYCAKEFNDVNVTTTKLLTTFEKLRTETQRRNSTQIWCCFQTPRFVSFEKPNSG